MEEEALNQVQILLDGGETPLAVFDLCFRGLNEVGQRYQKEIYALSGLIMAGDIMRRIGLILLPMLEGNAGRSNAVGSFLPLWRETFTLSEKIFSKPWSRVMGLPYTTWASMYLPPKSCLPFLNTNPDIVGLSCLISAAYQAMADTIRFLRQNVPEDLSPRAYIIGGRIDQYVSEQIDADYWTNDAIEGVALCERIMTPPIRSIDPNLTGR